MSDDPNQEVTHASSPSTLVALVDLADELQINRSSIFKIYKRLDIQPTKRRDAARGNQLTLLVSEAQASVIRADVRGNRRTDSAGRSDAPEFLSDEGWFYLIQLEPALDPGRIKVGFTTDRDGRISNHRCSEPFAVYHKSWPCRRTWERTAIDCVTAGLEQLHTEVFRGPSVEAVAARGDQFFLLMPVVVVSPETDDTVGPDETAG